MMYLWCMMRNLICCIAALAVGGDFDVVVSADEPRAVVVRVPARPLADRPQDEMPAEFSLTAPAFPADRCVDLSSLEVHRWNAAQQRPEGEPLPTRWYDAALPEEFPIVDGNASSTDGKTFQWETRRRWAEFFPIIGEGKAGKIAWLHRQTGSDAAEYQISFRLLPVGASPTTMPRRGFLGDGSPRCEPQGASSTGMVHSRLAVADWNQDGLVDLLVGGTIGNVIWYPNLGTKTEPKFSIAKLLYQSDGKPFDVGWGAVPFVVDWDGDGKQDVLTGAERNRLLFYQNLGDNGAPALLNQGFVELNGQPLILPVAPVPNAPEAVFHIDYYPVLDVTDWDGNGQRDLLAGGYITGRVFRYEQTGRRPDGVPILEDRGPLLADGEPLNVEDWAAAPTAADFDDDGDLDLISGNMPVNKQGGDDLRPDVFLVYFENIGTRTKPRLTRKPLPIRGKFPRDVLATPRAVDLNADGLLDLAVSANTNIYLFFNVGTKTEPLFDVSSPRLPSAWGTSPLPTFGLQFLDFNGDGKRDYLSGLSIYLETEPGKQQRTALLAPDCPIEHPPPHGDAWMFTQLADLNGDDRLDLLYGTHEGHVWLHAASDRQGYYDQAGVRLARADGQPVHVGPVPGQDLKDFTILQGSRTTLTTADFDRDGLIDLVVGDTDGVARYFRNVGTRRQPVFELVHEFETLGIRMVPFAADWNHDGRMDVVGSAANGKVMVWLNRGDNAFDAGRAIEFPSIPYGPNVSVVDWNQDGDDDLIIGTAYGFFCWFERSFLEQGAVQAELIEVSR